MYLNDDTKSAFKETTGLDYSEILTLTHDELMVFQKKNHPKIGFSKIRKKHRFGRGNPLLSHRKFRTTEDLDRKFNMFKRVK